MEELFGDRYAVAVYDLPCRVIKLSETLNKSGLRYSADEFIQQNSMFPLYRNFAEKAMADRAYTAMCSEYGGSIHSMLGITASSVSGLQYFKFCSQCNAESKSKNGELYFNRLHQMAFVHFCPIHGSPLVHSSIRVRQYNRHEFAYPDAENMRIGVLKTYTRYERDVLLKVSVTAKELIESKTDLSGFDFRQRYFCLLRQRGFVRGDSQVDNIKLFAEFNKNFGERLLSALNCSVANDEWLISIVRKHRKSFHPIRHILMILFLSGSLSEFIKTESEYIARVECCFGIRKSFSAYHECWLMLKQKYPEKSKTELRHISPKTYTWLYRHDRKWLDENSPIKKVAAQINRRVDWKQRDNEISVVAASSISMLKKAEYPFLRVTIGRIGRLIGKLSLLEKHLDKLPETKRIISEQLESVAEFQKRKIDCVIDRMIEHNTSLYEAHVFRQASITKGRRADIDRYLIDKICAHGTMLKMYEIS